MGRRSRTDVDPLVGVLAAFLLGGLLQVLFAGRIADLIHGGPDRRGPRGRALDLLVLRAAGGFIVLLSGAVLVILALSGAL